MTSTIVPISSLYFLRFLCWNFSARIFIYDPHRLQNLFITLHDQNSFKIFSIQLTLFKFYALNFSENSRLFKNLKQSSDEYDNQKYFLPVALGKNSSVFFQIYMLTCHLQEPAISEKLTSDPSCEQNPITHILRFLILMYKMEWI